MVKLILADRQNNSNYTKLNQNNTQVVSTHNLAIKILNLSSVMLTQARIVVNFVVNYYQCMYYNLMKLPKLKVILTINLSNNLISPYPHLNRNLISFCRLHRLIG